jgi:hypothetical protein
MLSVINDAAALESARRIDEAQSACQECLDIAARERLPVTIDVLPPIWNGLGSCYANRNDLAGALDWYAKVEECLHAVGAMMAREGSPATDSSRPAWYRHLPEGVVVLIPENFAWKDHMANVYDARGVAYDNKNDVARAPTTTITRPGFTTISATPRANRWSGFTRHMHASDADNGTAWVWPRKRCESSPSEHRTKARSCRRSGC